jgi:hypothetical protein
MRGRRPDAEKEQYWRKTIREAARSGMSVRSYCHQHKLSESQFHWWQRKLEEKRRPGKPGRKGAAVAQASFALVSDDPEGMAVVIGKDRRPVMSAMEEYKGKGGTVEACQVFTPSSTNESRQLTISIPTAALATKERKLDAVVAVFTKDEVIEVSRQTKVSFPK